MGIALRDLFYGLAPMQHSAITAGAGIAARSAICVYNELGHLMLKTGCLAQKYCNYRKEANFNIQNGVMKTTLALISILVSLSFAVIAQDRVIATSPAYDNVDKDKRIKDHAKHALMVNEPAAKDPAELMLIYDYFSVGNRNAGLYPREASLKPLHLRKYGSAIPVR
jgi:hypothetical protein